MVYTLSLRMVNNSKGGAMGVKKTALSLIMILVFGVLSTAAASTYFFQPASSSLNVFDEGGNINWSDLFDSIEQYNPGSHVEMYTHSGDTAGGETALNGPANSGGFFAGQGLSLDPWSGVSGHEKFSAVVAALAGCIGTDLFDYSSQTDRRFSFNTFGETCSPRRPPVPLPGSLWFLFSGFGTLLATRRWRRK